MQADSSSGQRAELEQQNEGNQELTHGGTVPKRSGGVKRGAKI